MLYGNCDLILWVFYIKDKVEVYHKPFNLGPPIFQQTKTTSPFGTEMIPRHGVYPKALPTLSSLSVQCLDLGHLVSIRQSTERLPSKDTAGGTYSPCSWKLKNSQKHSCGRQAAPRTRIWEDHTKHLRVFCLLALALRVRNVRDASITQLGTTCS